MRRREAGTAAALLLQRPAPLAIRQLHTAVQPGGAAGVAQGGDGIELDRTIDHCAAQEQRTVGVHQRRRLTVTKPVQLDALPAQLIRGDQGAVAAEHIQALQADATRCVVGQGQTCGGAG